jgi:hypothetical protein
MLTTAVVKLFFLFTLSSGLISHFVCHWQAFDSLVDSLGYDQEPTLGVESGLGLLTNIGQSYKARKGQLTCVSNEAIKFYNIGGRLIRQRPA